MKKAPVATVENRLRRLIDFAWRTRVAAGLSVRNWRSKASILGNAPVIVSLTSYGGRVKTTPLAIESIGAGLTRPRRLILWLTPEDLQVSLRMPAFQRLVSRGLELRASDDFGPHKKYFPTLEIAIEEGVDIVTADDDVMYPASWLEGLIQAAREDPETLTCWRAHRVSFDGSGLAPYNEWKACTSARASHRHFSTGVAGVLYPWSLIQALRHRGTAFLRCAPKADDVWVNAVAAEEGIRCRQVEATSAQYPTIPMSQRVGLHRSNVMGSGNDVQIRATYDARVVQRMIADR